MVSVLIPVYNSEKYISKCIDSVLNQSYKDLEIVIVNDGSTDGSLKILQDYQNKYNNIFVYSFKNSGISVTRNRLIQLSKGEYITFLDSDDFIESDMIENMMKLIINDECDIACCGYVMDYGIFPFRRNVCKTGFMTSKEAILSLASNSGMNNYPWAKIFSRKCFENVQFPEGMNSFEDMYTIYLAIMNSNKIGNLSNRYYHYCQHKGSITNKMSVDMVYKMRKSYEDQEVNLKKYYPEEDICYDTHFYNSDMFLLYTILTSKGKYKFNPGRINWDNISFIKKIGYKVLESLVLKE